MKSLLGAVKRGQVWWGIHQQVEGVWEYDLLFSIWYEGILCKSGLAI